MLVLMSLRASRQSRGVSLATKTHRTLLCQTLALRNHRSFSHGKLEAAPQMLLPYLSIPYDAVHTGVPCGMDSPLCCVHFFQKEPRKFGEHVATTTSCIKADFSHCGNILNVFPLQSHLCQGIFAHVSVLEQFPISGRSLQRVHELLFSLLLLFLFSRTTKEEVAEATAK